MQNDLISRKDLDFRFGYYISHCMETDPDYAVWEHALKEVREIRSIDAVPVVHARWEIRDKIIVCAGEKGCYEALYWNFYTRDRCFAGKLPDYCPFCGAKMDGGAEG